MTQGEVFCRIWAVTIAYLDSKEANQVLLLTHGLHFTYEEAKRRTLATWTGLLPLPNILEPQNNFPQGFSVILELSKLN